MKRLILRTSAAAVIAVGCVVIGCTPTLALANGRSRSARTGQLARPMLATFAPASHTRIYWGASIGSQYTGTSAPWDMTAVTDFERITHKAPSIVSFYSSFASCAATCQGVPFPGDLFSAIRSRGAIPMLSWGSDAEQSPSFDADFTLSDIAAGRWDSYLRAFATAARRWGHPFFLRLDWEMNGNWFPWGGLVNGNSPAEFVAAWRHIHNVFSAAGAHNVTWVWCPNISSDAGLRGEYPGSQYVDWTCLDGYNWGNALPKNVAGGWQSFTQLYQSSYRQLLALAPSKPIMVGEFASTADGGSKTDWLRNALSVVPRRFKRIRALVYFDRYASGMDWPLLPNTSAAQAFAGGIAAPVYATNSFRHLSQAPIPVPGSDG